MVWPFDYCCHCLSRRWGEQFICRLTRWLLGVSLIARYMGPTWGPSGADTSSEHMSRVKCMSTFCELPHRWISQNKFDDNVTLVLVMVWCCQATSYYQSQSWPFSVSLYNVTSPPWVNTSDLHSILMSKNDTVRVALITTTKLKSTFITKSTRASIPSHKWNPQSNQWINQLIL